MRPTTPVIYVPAKISPSSRLSGHVPIRNITSRVLELDRRNSVLVLFAFKEELVSINSEIHYGDRHRRTSMNGVFRP
jgi:hypothetical protein